MVHIIFIFHTKSRWNPTLWLLNDVCCQSNFHCWAFRLVLAPQWCTIFILYSYYLHLHVNTSRHTTTNHNGCVPPDFCFHDISPCYNEAYAPVGVTCKHPPRRTGEGPSEGGTLDRIEVALAAHQRTDHTRLESPKLCVYILYTCFFASGCEVNHGRHGHGQKVSKHHNLHGGRWSTYLGDDFGVGIHWTSVTRDLIIAC